MKDFSEALFTTLVILFAVATIATYIFTREWCAPCGVLCASSIMLILSIDAADRALFKAYNRPNH